MTPSEQEPSVRSPEASFQFNGIGITRFTFVEVAKIPLEAGKKAADYSSLTFNVGAELALVSEDKAELRLRFRIVPDPHVRPYEIELEMVGAFSSSSADRNELVRFCRTNAPAVMFPYARQAVNEVTSNARFGSVRLPLMNLGGLLGEHSTWVEVVPPEEQSEVRAPAKVAAKSAASRRREQGVASHARGRRNEP